MEARGGCGDADVGVHRERHAEADSDTVHPGDDRLLAVDAHEHREVVDAVALSGVFAVGARLGRRVVAARLIEVEARAERVAVPGDRNRPHVVVGRGGADGAGEALDEVAGQRVLAVRAVEPEDAQSLDVLDLECLRHGRFLTVGAPAPRCGRRRPARARPRGEQARSPRRACRAGPAGGGARPSGSRPVPACWRSAAERSA